MKNYRQMRAYYSRPIEVCLPMWLFLLLLLFALVGLNHTTNGIIDWLRG